MCSPPDWRGGNGRRGDAHRPPAGLLQAGGQLQTPARAVERGGLRAQLDRIAQAELHIKTTGLPAETICREALLAVAQAAGFLVMRQGLPHADKRRAQAHIGDGIREPGAFSASRLRAPS